MNFFKKIEKEIIEKGFKIISKDFERPWGGFLVIDESQAQDFANTFFDGINVETLKIGGKLSPKILIVSPNSKLSWQYHHRRAEIWRVFKGKVGVSRSFDDLEKPVKILNEKDQIKLKLTNATLSYRLSSQVMFQLKSLVDYNSEDFLNPRLALKYRYDF